jgi:TonB family protein
MNWIGMLLLWVLATASQAEEVFLIPESNPGPEYPRVLQRAGITGDVRVSFTVHADGSVNKVSVLQSDHPALAQSALAAVKRWRFKPWTVEGDKPSEQEVHAPLAFRMQAPPGINQWIKALPCREVNAYLANVAEYSWVDSLPFHYTRSYLSNTVFQHQLSNKQRLALIARLNRRVSDVVVRCRERPASKFMTFLPEDIRQLL